MLPVSYFAEATGGLFRRGFSNAASCLQCYVVYKKCFLSLTPSNECEAPEVFGVWSKGHEDETVEVEAFHKDPVVVSGQKIDEEQDCHLAANLITKH